MNALQTLVDSPAIRRLGWTLLHSAWQGAVVAVVLGAALPAVRRRGARATYAACCGALLLTLLLPALTFCLLTDSPPTQKISLASASAIDKKEISAVARPSSISPPLVDLAHATIKTGDDRRPIPQASIETPQSAETRSSQESATVTSTWAEKTVTLRQQLSDRLASWLPWTVLAWTVGVLALSLWNVAGWFTARRLKSQGTSFVSAGIQQAATRIAQQLGVTRGVRVLQSAMIECPVVIGAFKPVILLPASLLTQIPADQLESLLAHELAHVVRHDYLVNLLQSVMETLLFYHPAVWWISAQVRAERENCCDDLALAVTGNRAVYVRALASVAGARASTIVPAATGGLLIARLRRILGVVDPVATHPSRWLTGVAMFALGGAAVALFAMASRPATAQVSPIKGEKQKSPTAPRLRTSGRMQIQVLDEKANAVSNALVNVEMVTGDGSRKVRDYQCDAQGQVSVELPKSLESLQLFASKPRWLKDSKAFWANSQNNQSAVPENVRFRLLRPIEIGGIVCNERGQRIAGARIQFRDGTTGAQSEALSDAKGRWQIDKIRPGARGADQLDVTHPDYLTNRTLLGLVWKQNAFTFDTLRSQDAIVVLHPGVLVTGKVTDPAGAPIESASVFYGGSAGEVPDHCQTDHEGKFRFRAKEGPLGVTVFAQGWMPEQRTVALAPGMRPTDFPLQRGKTLQLRVVDRAGTPVSGVGVILGPWRGFNSNPFQRELKLPFQTDKNGLFEWSWAPEDRLSFDLIKAGFADTAIQVVADGREQTVTINPLLHISGTVVDAHTGRPIDAFVAIPIHYHHLNQAYIPRSDLQRCRAGQFDMAFDGVVGPDIYAHGLQIEAPGYNSYRTEHNYKIGDATNALRVRLEPCERYVGRVVDGKGQPVSRADVLVSSKSEPGAIRDLEELSNQPRSGLHFRTDQNGTFEMPSPLEPYGVQVVSPAGYGAVERPSTQLPGQIQIANWARVTGRVVHSGEAVPNCPVMIEPNAISASGVRLYTRCQGTTRADGTFVIERVPPVASAIYWNLTSPHASARWFPVQLKPGETRAVLLGGKGIEVTGQLVAENQPASFDYQFAINDLVAKRPGIEPPAFLAGKGFDWKRGWTLDWLTTSEGRAYLSTLEHWYVTPEPNGQFRISGIGPGEYDLAVNLFGKTIDEPLVPVASRVVHLTINPGQSHLDLGKILIPPFKPPTKP